MLNVAALCLLCQFETLEASVQLSTPETVTAGQGGSVTVSCQYDHQFRENTKYWCRGRVYELCVIVVKTPRKPAADRSSIVDDKEAGVVTVTMTSLRKGDEGMYWCVIATSGRNIYSGVRLLVSHTGVLFVLMLCSEICVTLKIQLLFSPRLNHQRFYLC